MLLVVFSFFFFLIIESSTSSREVKDTTTAPIKESHSDKDTLSDSKAINCYQISLLYPRSIFVESPPSSSSSLVRPDNEITTTLDKILHPDLTNLILSYDTEFERIVSDLVNHSRESLQEGYENTMDFMNMYKRLTNLESTGLNTTYHNFMNYISSLIYLSMTFLINGIEGDAITIQTYLSSLEKRANESYFLNIFWKP